MIKILEIKNCDWAKKIIDSFVRGLKVNNVPFEIINPKDIIFDVNSTYVCCSIEEEVFEIVKKLISEKKYSFYYIDNSYFKFNLYKKYRITYNGWTNNNIVVSQKNDRGDKPNFKDWSDKGNYILGLESLNQEKITNEKNWLKESLKKLSDKYNLTYLIRSKPKKPQLMDYNDELFLSKLIEGSKIVVSHSSGVQLQAMCLGKPVYSSIYGPLYSYNEKINFDRLSIINHFYYSEFSKEEMSSGLAWKILKSY